jgi:hypothetical protein
MRHRYLLAGLVGALFACGGEEPRESAVEEIVDPTGTASLFAQPDAAVPYWHEENQRKRDPAADDWRSEVLHELAKAAMKDLLGRLLHEGHGESWEELLADDFVGATALVPAELEIVFEDGETTVRHGEVGDARHGRSDFPRLGQALRANFAESAEVHPHFKIIRVEVQSATAFDTVAVLHMAGAASAGEVQVNSEWRLGWQVLGEDEAVRLRSAEVLQYEQVTTGGRLFVDLTEHALGGLDFFERELLLGVPEYFQRTDFFLVGSSLPGMQGIAVGDLDGDGLDDIYLPQQGGLPNRLLLRQPDGTAADATERSGLGFLDNTRSALIADLDNDGDQDLVASLGAVILVAFNDGSARFTEFVPLRAPGPDEVYSMVAADPDEDGDLDIFACRYSSRDNLSGSPRPFHEANNGAPNVYWRNDGDGKFSDATEEMGFGVANHKFTYAAIWEDFDLDGDLDLYVANDFGLNNLFRNDDGYFKDVAVEVGAADQSSGMGVSVGDYDLDGDMDLYVTNMFSSAGRRIVPQTERYMKGENQEVHATHLRFARGNSLLANRGDGTFEDVTEQAGVAIGGWAWGAKFLDLNNDGLEDLYSPNGYITNDDPGDT